MDSLTQAALGATVGHTLLGKHIGRAAPIIGAALGTLPDLDVFIPFGGEVENFTYHRGFSHSLLVQLAVTPLIAWLFTRYRSKDAVTFKQWFIAVLAIFWTHSLLDACTVYGTQLLWPITEHPFGVSSVFIIDPFYTLPLLISLFVAYKKDWHSSAARTATAFALVVSSVYLLWGYAAKNIAEDKIIQAFVDQGHQPEEIVAIVSTPMPLTSVLWRAVIIEGGRYHIAHLALWEEPETVNFRTLPKGEEWLKGLESHWDVQRLIWFTKGFYKAELRDGQIVMSDLRMGIEGAYAFNFAVAELSELVPPAPVKAIRIEDSIDWSKMPVLWERLWDPHVSLHPDISQPSLGL